MELRKQNLELQQQYLALQQKHFDLQRQTYHSTPEQQPFLQQGQQHQQYMQEVPREDRIEVAPPRSAVV
jgi:hypothetical protein